MGLPEPLAISVINGEGLHTDPPQNIFYEGCETMKLIALSIKIVIFLFFNNSLPGIRTRPVRL